MPEQLILPFGYKYAEDRASLLIAINAAGLRRLDKAFVLLVLDVTGNGWLHKSYNELADWLHVSKSTARRVVARCVEAGLVVAAEERYRSGGQRDNAYAIDWDGVRARCFNATLIDGPVARDTVPPVAAGQGEQPPAQNEHPPAHPEQPPAQNEHPYKEYIPPSDPPKNPPPPPERPGGGGGSSAGWGEVRSRLRDHGMADDVGAIRAAQRDGLSAGTAGELIDHWEAARPAWDVGALYWRLTRGTWPERSAPSREHDWARQERERTRELLSAVPCRARADPSEPSLVEQLRQLRDQDGDP
jgi:hypothetical protein